MLKAAAFVFVVPAQLNTSLKGEHHEENRIYRGGLAVVAAITAGAALAACSSPSSAPDAAGVSGGECVSVREIMDTMATVTGINFEPELCDRRPGDPARIVANGDLAARDLGWKMRHSLQEMAASAFTAAKEKRRETL